LFFVVLRLIMYRFHIPDDLYDLELFGPIPFGKSDWLPSLGDVFINTFLILFVMIQFFLSYKLPERVYKGRNPESTVAISILLVILTVFFIYTHNILSNLILHSIISFEFYKAASLNVYTFIGLLIMVMHFAAILLIANKLLAVCKLRCRFAKLLIMLMGISAGIFSIFYLFDYRLDAGSYIAYFIIFLPLAIMQYRKVPLGNYTTMALMVILFSAYSVYIIAHCNNRKITDNMAVMAENLSAQHDAVAEYLLEDISERLSKDETLSRYLLYWNLSDTLMHNYLQTNYFNGFWGKYMLLYTECGPSYTILVDDTVTNCYSFFKDRIAEGKSMQLPATRFYFLDSQNGRINYLGWFSYYNPDSTEEISLFIELESRLIAEELGFPELLLDERIGRRIVGGRIV